MNTYETELRHAADIAREVGEYQRRAQKEIGRIHIKEDSSPVTEVDTTCENIIYRALSRAFPEDGFFGEEGGIRAGTSGRRWIVDPIDGTRPYIRGIPTYSTLIALEDHGEITVGVVNLPALGECYTARLGGGAFCNDTPISVSNTSSLEAAMGAFLGTVETAREPRGKKLFSLMEHIDYPYGFMDAYTYMAVASGKLDLAVGMIDFPWDRASAAIIVKEAGGKCTDSLNKETIYGDTFILSNKKIHPEIVPYLK
ncbi:inositol monophosphatase family protein [Chitinivibrio alkaliphilus]|uniref:Inositol monophosphatase family protein n=1 Tax=Chitinivibrio alkaliphilus ACht1 TaxID=1313304 RepID=U7DC68_9BACT|nr:inositol monophosphatase [Chitinivibrio alkaliphilus]ERP39173.1 inositol monophosphatase family protein [Chitinivibrio alkaliphilus ACht1]